MSHTLERGELYAAVWQEPATAVAARYGITSTALAKICRKLRVPTPPRGYWARKAAGQRVARTPLPKLAPGQRTVHVITEAASRPSPHVGELVEAEKARDPIVVPEVVVEFHPLVRKYEARLRRRGQDTNIWRTMECIQIRVSRDQLDRAFRIMHTLIVAFDERGLEIEVSRPEERKDGSIQPSVTMVVVEGVRVAFGLEEMTRWEQPEIAPPPGRSGARRASAVSDRAAEIVASLRAAAAEREARQLGRHVPTGELRLWSDPGVRLRTSVQRSVRDTAQQRVEQRLGRFVAQLYALAGTVRREQAEDQERRRQWEAAERARAEQARIQQRQDRLREDLGRRVEAFRRAGEIRALIAAVEARRDLTPSARAWIQWAHGRAEVLERSALEVELVWDRA